MPEALSRRLPSVGRDDPWGWWTRAEVCAKLLDVPIIVWVTRHGWPHEGELVVEGQVVRLSTHRGDGLVLSLGRLAPAAAG